MTSSPGVDRIAKISKVIIVGRMKALAVHYF